MKREIFITAVMALLLWAGPAGAGVSIVMNGSFERDSEGISDIKFVAPQRWCDVNWPDDPNKFDGYVGTSWNTDGNYCLTLYVQPIPTNANDIVKVSQQIYLEDANEITLDVKLSSALSFLPWDPLIRTAVVQIDGNDVWISSDWEPDENGEYRNQIIEVNDVYKNANPHMLSLGIRTIIYDEPAVEYYVDWDFVRFDTYFEAYDYMLQDLNLDYCVDANDLALLASQWLMDDPNEEYDLFQDDDNIINFHDFVVFASRWMATNFGPLLTADLNDDGIVDFLDFAILAGNWRAEGPCIRGDIDRTGASTAVVDYQDLSIMSDEWLQKSWLYGLE